MRPILVEATRYQEISRPASPGSWGMPSSGPSHLSGEIRSGWKFFTMPRGGRSIGASLRIARSTSSSRLSPLPDRQAAPCWMSASSIAERHRSSFFPLRAHRAAIDRRWNGGLSPNLTNMQLHRAMNSSSSGVPLEIPIFGLRSGPAAISAKSSPRTWRRMSGSPRTSNCSLSVVTACNLRSCGADSRHHREPSCPGSMSGCRWHGAHCRVPSRS